MPRICFLPWVTLPEPMMVDGFCFVPLRAEESASLMGRERGDTVRTILASYVDQAGTPVASCTLVSRQNESDPWDIPQALWPELKAATDILAFSCLSEQRFFEGHFAPHLNATMFRLVSQGFSIGSDQIGIFYLRRGGGLGVGGRRASDTVFQQPWQVEGTECKTVNASLVAAMLQAKDLRSPAWAAIVPALDMFLLANSETPDLTWDTCNMLSAMAFERLLAPKQRGAQVLAEAFSHLWKPFAGRTIAQAQRIKPDHKVAWQADQASWPIHQKWMKELYEARSSAVHAGPRSDFSTNWDDWQHVVIAAFVFPLVVKIMLNSGDLYSLTDDEEAACEALDDLLDSRWTADEIGRPEWPEILSQAKGARAISRAVEAAWSKVQNS